MLITLVDMFLKRQSWSDWLVWQEKESRLKKLHETVDMEIEQETRKAKVDKESAIK